MPLAIGLRLKESVLIGEAKVTIVSTGAEVKLSIEAPREMLVVRDELKRRDEFRAETAALAQETGLRAIIERLGVQQESENQKWRDKFNELSAKWTNEVFALKTENARLKSQLPEGMENCTIKFISCPVGHGRLAATNWINNGCCHCEIERLKRASGYDAVIDADRISPHWTDKLVEDLPWLTVVTKTMTGSSTQEIDAPCGNSDTKQDE